jgi:hypothetical protein
MVTEKPRDPRKEEGHKRILHPPNQKLNTERNRAIQAADSSAAAPQLTTVGLAVLPAVICQGLPGQKENTRQLPVGCLMFLQDTPLAAAQRLPRLPIWIIYHGYPVISRTIADFVMKTTLFILRLTANSCLIDLMVKWSITMRIIAVSFKKAACFRAWIFSRDRSWFIHNFTLFCVILTCRKRGGNGAFHPLVQRGRAVRMNTKKVIIYMIIAVAIGVVLGGISKLFDVDLDIFAFIIPVVVFAALSGGAQVISKKKNDEKKDDTDEE